MKRSTAIILAALLLSTAALSGCAQSGNNNAASAPSDTSTAASSQDSSAAESTESEISDTESSVVSEVTSSESSEEISKASKVESSDNKSKTESSQTKTEEKSKPESSKSETSKTETSKAETSKPQEIKATGINVNLSALSLTAGYGQELNAEVQWSDGTSYYVQGITWSSSNSSVASVSSTGYVTAKSAGTATITASYGSFKKTCTVTVKAAQQLSSQSSQPSQPTKPSQQSQPSQQTKPSGNSNSGNNDNQSSKQSGDNHSSGNESIFEKTPDIENPDYEQVWTSETPALLISHKAITIATGDTKRVGLRVSDDNFGAVKCESSNPSVAYVREVMDGVIPMT